jgi:hypothetical protein
VEWSQKPYAQWEEKPLDATEWELWLIGRNIQPSDQVAQTCLPSSTVFYSSFCLQPDIRSHSISNEYNIFEHDELYSGSLHVWRWLDEPTVALQLYFSPAHIYAHARKFRVYKKSKDLLRFLNWIAMCSRPRCVEVRRKNSTPRWDCNMMFLADSRLNDAGTCKFILVRSTFESRRDNCPARSKSSYIGLEVLELF